MSDEQSPKIRPTPEDLRSRFALWNFDGARQFAQETLAEVADEPHDLAMPDPITRDEISARFDAADARTDAKFARLDGRLDAMNVRIDSIDSAVQEIKTDMKTLRLTVITTGIASFIAIIGLAYSLHQSSLASQANLLSAFQAGLTALSTKTPNP